jgi:hypothetical protein
VFHIFLVTYLLTNLGIPSPVPPLPPFCDLLNTAVHFFGSRRLHRLSRSLTMHDANPTTRPVGPSDDTRMPEFILQAPADVFGRPTSSWTEVPLSASTTASNSNAGRTDPHPSFLRLHPLQRSVLRPRPMQRCGISPHRFLDGSCDNVGFVAVPDRQGDVIRKKRALIPPHPFEATSSAAAMHSWSYPNHEDSRSDFFSRCGPVKLQKGNCYERHQPDALSQGDVGEDDLGLKPAPKFTMTPTPSRNEMTNHMITSNAIGAKPFFMISPPHRISLLPRKYHQHQNHGNNRIPASNIASSNWVASSCHESKEMNDSGYQGHDANSNDDSHIHKPTVLSPSVLGTHFSCLALPRESESEHISESERATAVVETTPTHHRYQPSLPRL